MKDFVLLNKALKLTWVKRLCSAWDAPWKYIPKSFLSTIGGTDLFQCNYDYNLLDLTAAINSSGVHAHPPTPWVTAGHLLTLSARGWGIRKFITAWGLSISISQGGPRHLTRMFSKDGWVYWEWQGLCQSQSFLPKERVSVKCGPDSSGWQMAEEKCGWKNADDKMRMKNCQWHYICMQMIKSLSGKISIRHFLKVLFVSKPSHLIELKLGEVQYFIFNPKQFKTL